MRILVYDSDMEKSKNENSKKPKNIICPKCKENIKMDIKDFKINLYECKNGHEIKNILLNEFDETQSIELDKIICDTCKIKDKSKTYNNEFFKCLKCNKNLCPLCKSKHDNKHEIIDIKLFISNK